MSEGMMKTLSIINVACMFKNVTQDRKADRENDVLHMTKEVMFSWYTNFQSKPAFLFITSF